MIIEFFKGNIPFDYGIAYSAYVGTICAAIVCCFVMFIACIIGYFIERRLKKK